MAALDRGFEIWCVHGAGALRLAGWLRTVSPRGLRLLVALFGIGLSVGALALRKELIRSFFRLAPPGPAARLPGADLPGPSLGATTRLRVVLLDGLGAEEAATLPVLSTRCQGGLDLQLDVGFPTVSLPVQAALWSGRTQQHGGILFRTARLPEPPPGALPARVAGSVAIAEAHAEIVHSFGFAQAKPAAADGARPAGSWSRREDFEAAAELAVRSEERLVFIHVLRVDRAGHEAGAASPAYHAAAREADVLLLRLVEAEGLAHPDGATRWVVLSDHGHLPAGGHGDAESALRHTRACLWGALPAGLAAKGGTLIHLVDLARILFDSLGVAPPADHDGRPLSVALAVPAKDATLPSPPLGRVVAALLLVLAALAARLAPSPRAALRPLTQRRRWALELWWWVGTASIVLLIEPSSLSGDQLFKTWPWKMAAASLPGLALVVLATTGGRAGPLGAVVAHAFALPMALTLSSLLLCGGEAALLSTAPPPLLPFVTALADTWLLLLATGTLALASAALAGAARAASDPP